MTRHSNRGGAEHREAAAESQHAADLAQCGSMVEPVKRVGHGDGRHRPIGQRDRLGRPVSHPLGADARLEQRAQRRLRLDGGDVQPTTRRARVSFPVPAARSSTGAPAARCSSAATRAMTAGAYSARPRSYAPATVAKCVASGCSVTAAQPRRSASARRRRSCRGRTPTAAGRPCETSVRRGHRPRP